ncbi:hypothetical protein AMECASPLE_008632, partial [Ameca splendens]
HNERKVTCKHPVSDLPSQDNCIFVVNEQTASKVPANDKKERPISTMSEAYNNTPISDCAANSNSPAGRVAQRMLADQILSVERTNPDSLVIVVGDFNK